MRQIWSNSGQKQLPRIISAAVFAAMLFLPTGILCAFSSANDGLEFVKNMGNGINIGNSLDATGLYERNPDTRELDFETSWGNPPISSRLFLTLRNSGMTTVRIPVSWRSHMDENGTISKVWLDQVQQVVDYALEADLYVILNTHHDPWQDLAAENTAEMERLLALAWKQIAERFTEYPAQLLFEGINEPRAVGTNWEWGDGTEENRNQVNRLNQIFVDTVRGCGENNHGRYLLITTCCSNVEEKALSALTIPDQRCIVSLHYYRPYSFCQQENGKRVWDPAREENMEETIQKVSDFFLSKHVPVFFTEIGCVNRENTEDRIKWTSALVSAANREGIPCLWWDNGSSYKIVNRESGRWRYPGIRNIFRNARAL